MGKHEAVHFIFLKNLANIYIVLLYTSLMTTMYEGRKINIMQEFDALVVSYNGWFTSQETRTEKRRRSLAGFLKGMGSIINLSGKQKNVTPDCPVYNRSDLSSEQKDAVLLASDLQRVDTDLDKILSGDMKSKQLSVADARGGKKFIQQIYGLSLIHI